MTSSEVQEPYLLSYRRDDIREDQRLIWQHRLIKHAILGGQLIHASVPVSEVTGAIADLGCGTGIWLDEVAKLLCTKRLNDNSSMFVGFDINAHAFNHDHALGVQLVEHDCTKPFDVKYIGKFDLVNIRGLAYAIPEERFPQMIENAVQLLRPGGYLQWLETESRLFRAYSESPDTLGITDALNAMNAERHERGLISYLPHFMLRQILASKPEASIPYNWPSGDLMTIITFSLLPGGISRESHFEDTALNTDFSQNLLESIKLALNGSLLRKKSLATDQLEDRNESNGQSETMKIQRLMDHIDEMRRTNRFLMGGNFPFLIAQKSTQF